MINNFFFLQTLFCSTNFYTQFYSHHFFIVQNLRYREEQTQNTLLKVPIYSSPFLFYTPGRNTRSLGNSLAHSISTKIREFKNPISTALFSPILTITGFLSDLSKFTEKTSLTKQPNQIAFFTKTIQLNTAYSHSLLNCIHSYLQIQLSLSQLNLHLHVSNLKRSLNHH